MTPTNAPWAEMKETHIGLVLLCGDRAYKIKKPVVTDFLDFGTPERRERAIARELELNRRLSPDVYLGVSHLDDPEGGPSEPVLVMRRMPDDDRLTRMLDDPERARTALSALLAMLARFHDGTDHGPEVDRAGTIEALRDRWALLLDGLTDPPVPGDTIKRITTLVHRFLDGRKPLLDSRIAEHRIVDGHGDLHAGDIFALPDGFRVLDCLDFDDELRHLDRLDDIAFLAMDLEFLGHPDLATTVIDEYCTATGDPAPPSLRHHYLAYRAVVRAKVNCIRHQQGGAESADHAVRHGEIALRHLEAGAVRLALVGGLPGTGKSTVAAELAAATQAVVLSSDHIRTRLRATGEIHGASGEYGHGAYSPEAKAAVYTALLDEARTHLGHGRSVILDASWTDAEQRRRAAALAEEADAALLEFVCRAPESVTAARIAARTGGESEATPAIAAAMAHDDTSWPEAVGLDTTIPLGETVARATHAWAATS
ncbi:AAA family ATPase [Nocardia sp. CDC159]|uniref:AAA family ATPase n=1 Tax=Nocardia pulmonis TaxID=2951408 RepID=A0A9X2E1E5_9NOCA|nr:MULTISPECIES: AAA family ATPase [Nocardia]MCM6772409.1 AAA family ATPase [Nocardia pulmonis]MCM6784933.1 AAA family ATPase [Nocardia sp. CDC159]